MAGALVAALLLLATSGCITSRLPPAPPLTDELIGDRLAMGGVRSFAYSSDGMQVAVASDSGRAYLWDESSHAFRAVMRVSAQPVAAVAYAGDRIVTADESGDLCCWDGQGHPTARLGRHGSPLLCLAAAHSGSEVWAGTSDGHILSWDLQASHSDHEFATGQGAIRGLALSPDDKTLYSGSDRALVAAWAVPSGTLQRASDEGAHQGPVNAVAVTPDGSSVFSACEDGDVRELDPASLKVTRTFVKVAGPVTSLAIHFGSLPLVAAGGRNHNVVVWNLAEKAGEEKSAQLRRDNRGPVWCVAFSPDGKEVAAGGEERDIVVHVLGQRVAKGQLPDEIGHPTEVTSVAYSPDDRWIASGGNGSQVLIWDPKTMALDRILPVEGEGGEEAGTIEAVAWSRRGLLATGAEDGGVRLYDAKGALVARARPNRRGHPSNGHSSQVNTVAFSSDGALLASGGWDRDIRIWKVPAASAAGAQELSLVGVLKGHTNGVSEVSFSGDGRQLASSSWDHTARIWDVPTQRQLEMLTGLEGPVFSAVFDPVQPVVVAGSWNGPTWFWSATDGSRLVSGLSDQPAPGSLEDKLLQKDVVFCLVFSPDARYLAAGSADRTVLFWNGQSRKPIRNFVGFHGGIRGISWTKDGGRLAIGTDDGYVFVLASPFATAAPSPAK